VEPIDPMNREFSIHDSGAGVNGVVVSAAFMEIAQW